MCHIVGRGHGPCRASLGSAPACCAVRGHDESWVTSGMSCQPYSIHGKSILNKKNTYQRMRTLQPSLCLFPSLALSDNLEVVDHVKERQILAGRIYARLKIV
jgi:hypothetical protein